MTWEASSHRVRFAVTAKTWLAAGIMFLAPPLARSLAAQDLPRVMIQTELGSMEVEVDTIRTPDVAGNFLNYVDHGAYRGGHFHRTVRAERQRGGKAEIQGIQGGLKASRSKDAPSIALEDKKDTGLSLGDKVPSLRGGRPDAATADFFIRVGDQPEVGRLDPAGGGFTPFGRVVRGREVVRLIQTARADQQRLTPPIAITNITRVK
jgi:peptidyl-prolyl cis-trans isomerase A (cyclophilin A)